MSSMLRGKTFSCVDLILLSLLLVACRRQLVMASGVFELEFLKIQQLSDSQPVRYQETTSTNTTGTTNQSKLNEKQPENLIRALVCLKEPFASQLDGPCTYGNASITLGGQESLVKLQELPTIKDSSNQLNQSNITQQQGSLLTNIVRILFTFRWTKSFTIILTTELLPMNGGQQIGQSLELATNRTSETSPQQVAFFDRHVLVENEVLPNNLGQTNKLTWASRFSRTPKSSIAYRFRVYCSLNYYGDGCNIFCRPRDDQFGHFNCSSTGQKVCLDGWQGPDCDRAKCRPGCNQQHGYCDKPDTCQCRPGWTGLRCDECITYPGCQNGYCLSPWQCICHRNWGGVMCDQDLNYCGTHEPCKNNGTCQNIAPGKYKCNCQDGFAGIDCDINLGVQLPASLGGGGGSSSLSSSQLSAGCILNPCLNGGTCFGFNNLQNSDHLIETFSSAEEPPLGVRLLVDNALNDQATAYRCQCAPGWTGDYCQWPDSSGNSLAVTSLLQNNSSTTSPQLANLTDAAVQGEQTTSSQQETELSVDKLITTFIRSAQTTNTPPTSGHLDLRHLISGVLASILGVFLAILLLVWCCMLSINRDRFPFIQMNIIRNSEGFDQNGQQVVTSTLRRMHAKIRDSLRRSPRSRIKPETKLSIENVLRPPPTYEESSRKISSSSLMSHYSTAISQQIDYEALEIKATPKKEDLVIRGTLDQGAYSKGSAIPSKAVSPSISLSSTQSTGALQLHVSSINFVSDAHLNCPRHGHLYRHRHATELQDQDGADSIEPATTPTRIEPHCLYHESGPYQNHYRGYS